MMIRFLLCWLTMSIMSHQAIAEEVNAPMPDFQVLQLLDAMQAGELGERLSAARKLYELENRSDEAIPYLLKLAESKSAENRRLACYVLGKWEIATDAVLRTFTTRITDKNADVRAMAVLGVSRLGSRAASTAKQLVTRLADTKEEPRIRAGAAMALSKLGTAGRLGVPEMIEALSSPHVQLRQMAETSLRDIEGFVVPGLALAAETREDPLGRSYACLQLYKLGLKAAGASDTLTRIVRKDPNSDVRADALKALSKITAELCQAQAELRQGVGFADDLSREVQQEKLLELEQRIHQAVLAFGFALEREDERPGSRMEAAFALADCKLAALPVRDSIDAAIDDPHPGVSRAAQEAKLRIIAALPQPK